MKIEELTPEQVAALSGRQQQWYAHWKNGSAEFGEALEASLPEEENEHA